MIHKKTKKKSDITCLGDTMRGIKTKKKTKNFWGCSYSIFHSHSSGLTQCLNSTVRRKSRFCEVHVDFDRMKSSWFKRCHLLLVSSLSHNSVSGWHSWLSVLQQSVLGPARCISKGLCFVNRSFQVSWHPRPGPQHWESWLASWRTCFVGCPCTLKEICGETFPPLRIRTDQNLWKELAQNHKAGTVEVDFCHNYY